MELTDVELVAVHRLTLRLGSRRPAVATTGRMFTDRTRRTPNTGLARRSSRVRCDRAWRHGPERWIHPRLRALERHLMCSQDLATPLSAESCTIWSSLSARYSMSWRIDQRVKGCPNFSWRVVAVATMKASSSRIAVRPDAGYGQAEHRTMNGQVILGVVAPPLERSLQREPWPTAVGKGPLRGRGSCASTIAVDHRTESSTTPRGNTGER